MHIKSVFSLIVVHQYQSLKLGLFDVTTDLENKNILQYLIYERLSLF